MEIKAETADSGFKSIELVKENDYDIVFMDHMMPGMDGLQATAKIRELGGKHAEQTIIALTANATRGVQEMFLAGGMNDYLSKPIELDRMSAMLKKWVPVEKVEVGAAVRQLINKAMPGLDGGGRHSSGLWEKVAETGHINVEIGKNRVAGIEEMYKELLDLLYGRLPDDCEKLEDFIKNGDLENFAILVHGMKSSLSTVGAMALSEQAGQLEKASKSGDLGTCGAVFPKFLMELRDLYQRLAVVCSSKDDKPSERPKGDPAILEKGIQAALKAVENYDGDKCLEVVDKLLRYDFGVASNGVLKAVKNAVKNFDFEKAVEELRRI
jgi:CheY-like chemotaxis protein